MFKAIIFNEKVMNICVLNKTATITTKHKLQDVQGDIDKAH